MTNGDDSATRDLRNLEKVRAIFASLSKYISAKAIYASNNPNVANFASAFYDSFRSFFHDEKELVLSIEQYRIKWCEETVYDNREKSDSIAFLLYKDGVGEITVQSSVTPAELERLVDLLRSGLYSPSSHMDIVSRLWQSEFTSISYRVFDECTDGAAGDGHGSGSESHEQLLQASDHPHAAAGDSRSGVTPPDPAPDSLGAYVEGLVDRVSPNATQREKEEHLQEMLSSLFTSSADDLASWRDNSARSNEGNKLLRLLGVMLDFAEMRSAPPVVRDIGDIIDRLVRYVVEEGHVPTLTALLDIQRTSCRNRPFAVEFQSLPVRIEHEITNGAFLLSLGKSKARSTKDAQEVLQYFRLIGEDAIPGVCELLTQLKDPSLHRSACDILIEIAGKDVGRIVNDLNLDNPYEARDAVYLLTHSLTAEIHPVAQKLMGSADPRVRELVIEYLAALGNDEAAAMLCRLLGDADPGVRIKTFAAVEASRHPMIVDRVLEVCFAEDNASKSADELERMFRAAGKLGGQRTLESVRHMIGKGSWFRIGKGRGRQTKLLAVTALRHSACPGAAELLGELAQDGESLVRTKAAYALKHLEPPVDSVAADLASVASEGTAP